LQKNKAVVIGSLRLKSLEDIIVPLSVKFLKVYIFIIANNIYLSSFALMRCAK